mmetsp:Transcript_11920/g.32033  ORF Transcript_11920/g.32033 Transcript_11920/m.32033 type:complete len:201 (+) Transcript_11920:702-1304(+)
MRRQTHSTGPHLAAHPPGDLWGLPRALCPPHRSGAYPLARTAPVAWCSTHPCPHPRRPRQRTLPRTHGTHARACRSTCGLHWHEGSCPRQRGPSPGGLQQRADSSGGYASNMTPRAHVGLSASPPRGPCYGQAAALAILLRHRAETALQLAAAAVRGMARRMALGLLATERAPWALLISSRPQARRRPRAKRTPPLRHGG